MPEIAVQPIVLRDMLLTIEENDYQKGVSVVEFSPSTSLVTWQGGTPDSTFTFPGATAWNCNITYAQDWDTDDSLSRYLLENEGETVDVVFAPVNGGPSFKARIVIVPGGIGGAVSAISTASVTLGVQGKPEYVAAATA